MEWNSVPGIPGLNLSLLPSFPAYLLPSRFVQVFNKHLVGQGRVLCARLCAVSCGLCQVLRTHCSDGDAIHLSWILILSRWGNVEHTPGQCGSYALSLAPPRACPFSAPTRALSDLGPGSCSAPSHAYPLDFSVLLP